MNATGAGAVSGLFVGLTTFDVVQRVAALPGPDEKVTALRADIAAGGPAANAAVSFAALGGHTVLASAVGTGPLAGATGRRSVVSRNAVGVTVAPSATLHEAVGEAQVVLVDGHHPALAVAACRAAREHAVPVVLDAGSWKPALPSLLPFVTVAVCSADFRMPDGTDPFAGLSSWGVQAVAITHGGDPVTWRDQLSSGEVAVPNIPVKDTLGAGDVFHGAFAYAWASGVRDLPAALKMATDVASVRVQHVGSRSWLRHVSPV